MIFLRKFTENHRFGKQNQQRGAQSVTGKQLSCADGQRMVAKSGEKAVGEADLLKSDQRADDQQDRKGGVQR